MFAPAPTVSSRYNPDFAHAVAKGLTQKHQKTLSPAWLYDDVGSALFEVITLLPEYGVTRAEAALLADASDEIVCAARRPGLIIELGSGAGTKTRHILNAAAKHRPVRYAPIDISSAALDICAKTLSNIRCVTIDPVEATYIDGIDMALAGRAAQEPALLLFLGSTIGNFDRPEGLAFLARVRQRMRPGDYLLLGADLVKPAAKLISAYDDPIGATAAFNLNLLARINRELDGDFNVSQFAHEARFNTQESRIEMHLRSRVSQTVHIRELGITISFTAGETIWTESSHKFRADEIATMAERSGWSHSRQWLDDEWGFAETLLQARP